MLLLSYGVLILLSKQIINSRFATGYGMRVSNVSVSFCTYAHLTPSSGLDLTLTSTSRLRTSSIKAKPVTDFN